MLLCLGVAGSAGMAPSPQASPPTPARDGGTATAATPTAADSLARSISSRIDAAEWAEAARVAGQLVAMRRAQGASARRELATALTYLSLAERNRGRFEAAEQAAREVVILARSEYRGESPTYATALNNLAGVLRERGQLVAAEALYRRSLLIRVEALGQAHAAVAASYNNLATLLQQQGESSEAERMLRDALASTRAGQGEAHPNVALGLQNLAAVLRRQQKLVEAEDCLRQAQRIVVERYGEGNVRTTYALQGLAEVLVAAGKHVEADSLLRACLALRERTLGPDHVETAQTRDRLGVLRSTLGRPADALALHEQALQATREAFGPAHPRTASTWGWLGGVHLRQGNAARAVEALSFAATAFEQARVRAASGIRRATLDLASPYPLLAAAQLLAGDGEAAWVSCERAQGRVLGELVAATRGARIPPALRAQRDSLVERLAQVEADLLRLHDAPDSARAAAAAAIDAQRALLLRCQAALAAVQEHIAAEHPEHEGRALASARVRATLGPDVAILGWLDADDPAGAVGRWGWVLRDSAPVRWYALALPPLHADPAQAPEQRLRAALRASGGGALGAAGIALPIAEARAVFEARMAPLVAALDGVRRVIVVPSGEMLGVPVEALVDAAGAPLLERFAVEYAPSATLHHALAGQQARSGAVLSGGKALLVGDPPFRREHLAPLHATDASAAGESTPRAAGVESAPTPSTGRTSSHESLQRLPRLRWSRREVEAVASTFAAPRLLLGADASEPRMEALVRDDLLGSFDVLHFATHALADLQRAEDCALVLAQVDLPDPVEALARGEPAYDGLVTASEILARWRLDADLVTLSACETALGRSAAGEGYLGLSHALLQAGSRCVLVSLWGVDDRATSLLMERFYRTAAGADPTETPRSLSSALREAKLWLRTYRDSSGRRPFEHPRYWAGFVLIGVAG